MMQYENMYWKDAIMSRMLETYQINKTDNGGIRLDEDKPRLDLIPPEAIMAIANVLGKSSAKYPERNWERGMAWGRTFAALQRHLWKFWGGEDYDKESGLPHLHHAICNLCFILTYQERNIGTDDRPRKE